jgi:hypothetical protein
MTQSRFSDTFGFSLDAVKHWEGGRRTPESSARAFLTVIARNPNAVIAALHPAKVATVGMKRFSSALTSSRKMARRAPTKAKPDRAARGSIEKLNRVLSKVSDAPAEAMDRL